jgi:NADH-quinone oxidoreductase subunit A
LYSNTFFNVEAAPFVWAVTVGEDGAPSMQSLFPWLPVAILFVLTSVLAFVVIGLSALLGPRRGSLRKLMPYESGMKPIGSAMQRTPVRFYLVAMIFILFDIEIIFMLPYALIHRRLGLFGLIEIFLFVGLLFVGYFYALKRGALRWD